jgi:hypothetical protein
MYLQVHTCIHTLIHTYIHTYIYTYTHPANSTVFSPEDIFHRHALYFLCVTSCSVSIKRSCRTVWYSLRENVVLLLKKMTARIHTNDCRNKSLYFSEIQSI